MNPLSMHSDNLASVKDDMVAFIEGHGIRRVPAHSGDDVPSITWDDENNADRWKDFVETAKAAGASFITMSEAVSKKRTSRCSSKRSRTRSTTWRWAARPNWKKRRRS